MGRPRIAVLISGTGSNLQALIEGVARREINGDIAVVISNRANALGLQKAKAAGIPTRVLSFSTFKAEGKSREVYDSTLASLVTEYAPDLVVLAGWMRILSPAFIDCFRERLINLHPALPGQFPGKNAIERAFDAYHQGRISGTGIMVHRVIEEVDAGTVLGTRHVAINAHDTLDSLAERIHLAEHKLLVEVVAGLCQSDVHEHTTD